jgi:hypothetical protein
LIRPPFLHFFFILLALVFLYHLDIVVVPVVVISVQDRYNCAREQQVRRSQIPETERTEQLKKIDERSVSRFEPAGIAAIFRAHGFCAIEDINFQEIASRFGRAVQGLAPGHAGLPIVHAKR